MCVNIMVMRISVCFIIDVVGVHVSATRSLGNDTQHDVAKLFRWRYCTINRKPKKHTEFQADICQSLALHRVHARAYGPI